MSRRANGSSLIDEIIQSWMNRFSGRLDVNEIIEDWNGLSGDVEMDVNIENGWE